MSAKAENKRKYSDPNVRMRKVNHTALVAITIIELFLIFALFVQTFAVKTSYGKLGIIPALILLIGMIVN